MRGVIELALCAAALVLVAGVSLFLIAESVLLVINIIATLLWGL